MPPNVDKVKMLNPKNKTTEEYIMLNPVSRNALITETLMAQLFNLNCSRYLERKCMALSTEIPSAILNISIVDGFIEMARKPIMAAVKICGSKLGVIEIMIILAEVNNSAIRIEIAISANIKLVSRFFIR